MVDQMEERMADKLVRRRVGRLVWMRVVPKDERTGALSVELLVDLKDERTADR